MPEVRPCPRPMITVPRTSDDALLACAHQATTDLKQPSWRFVQGGEGLRRTMERESQPRLMSPTAVRKVGFRPKVS